MHEVIINHFKVKKNLTPFKEFLVKECNFYIPMGLYNNTDELLNYLYIAGNVESIPIIINGKILYVYNGLKYLIYSDNSGYQLEVINHKVIEIRKINFNDKIYNIVFFEEENDIYFQGELENSKYSYFFRINDQKGNSYNLKNSVSYSGDRNKYIEDNFIALQNALNNNDELQISMEIKPSLSKLLQLPPVELIILNFISPLNFNLDIEKCKNSIIRVNEIISFEQMECGLKENKYPFLKKLADNHIEILMNAQVQSNNIINVNLEKISYLFNDRMEIFQQLQKRLDEAIKTYNHGFLLSSLVMLGSIVEGICYTAVDILREKGVKFKYFPKVNNEEMEMGRIPQFELIKILVEEGLFDAQLLDTMKVIKNFRNLIHPYHKDFSWPGVNLCDIAWNMLIIIIDKLKEHENEFKVK
jgi:hypothetical protein